MHLLAEPTRKRQKMKKADDVTYIAKQCLAEIRKYSAEVNGAKLAMAKDSDVVFGEYISLELKKFDSDITKDIIKAEIHNIFLKARLGQFNAFTSSSPLGVTTTSYGRLSACGTETRAEMSSMPCRTSPSCLIRRLPGETLESPQFVVIEAADSRASSPRTVFKSEPVSPVRDSLHCLVEADDLMRNVEDENSAN